MTQNERRRARALELEARMAPRRTVMELERWIGLYGTQAKALDNLADAERAMYQYETTASGRRKVSRRANRNEWDAETARRLGRVNYVVLKEIRA